MTPDTAADSQFRLFVEMMPHLAWMATRDGTLDYCNQRWSAYTGLIDTALGRSIFF